ACAHHDSVIDLALLHPATRCRILDRDLDHVADVRIAPLGTAEHLDAHDSPCAGVVGDVEYRLHLDHRSFSNLIRECRAAVIRCSRGHRSAASFGPRSGRTAAVNWSDIPPRETRSMTGTKQFRNPCAPPRDDKT